MIAWKEPSTSANESGCSWHAHVNATEMKKRPGGRALLILGSLDEVAVTYDLSPLSTRIELPLLRAPPTPVPQPRTVEGSLPSLESRV